MRAGASGIIDSDVLVLRVSAIDGAADDKSM